MEKKKKSKKKVSNTATINRYINNVIKNNKELLSQEEEIALSKKKDAGDKKAREKLILSNMRLVLSIANDYSNAGCDIEDLISEGNIGLTKGIDRFDWKKGFRVSTYTTWWIRQSVGRYIQEHSKSIKIPIHLQDINKKVQKIIKEYSNEFGMEPSISELSSLIDVPEEHIRRAMNASKNLMISINTPVQEGIDSFGELDKILKDKNSILPSESIERSEIENIITNIVDNLSPLEARIFKLRFGIDELEKN